MWLWLANEHFRDAPVSALLSDQLRANQVAETDHDTTGYRLFKPHPGRHPWDLTYSLHHRVRQSRRHAARDVDGIRLR